MSATDSKTDGQGEDPPPDDTLAGEFVLGVLEPAQHRRLEARIAADPAFAREVAAWEARLGLLAASVEPSPVAHTLWPKIQARLGWAPVERPSAGLWQSVGFWRTLTALAGAAVVALVISRGPLPRPGAPAPVGAEAPPVTALAHGDGTPGWLATVDAQRGTVVLVPVPAPADTQGRVPELWLIAPGAVPRPLGLLSSNRPDTVQVPTALRSALTAAAVLAVSLEPPGGAPHGAPTGPVIAQGMIRL